MLSNVPKKINQKQRKVLIYMYLQESKAGHIWDNICYKLLIVSKIGGFKSGHFLSRQWDIFCPNEYCVKVLIYSNIKETMSQKCPERIGIKILIYRLLCLFDEKFYGTFIGNRLGERKSNS